MATSTAQQTLTREQKIEMLHLLEEKERRIANQKLKRFTPYPWQDKFYTAGSACPQRLLMAANQVGKSDTGATEVAYHLTGLYPDWWQGLRFEAPILCWALGVSGETIKDNGQLKLFGQLTDNGFINNGFIGNNLIDVPGIVRSSQVRGLVKELLVKHVSGGWSRIVFKSYSQGQHALMGPVVDLIWIDEEPEDPEIYPQCLTRTTNGNRGKGGIIMMTFTPENGVTLLVDQFMNRLQKGQYLLNVTWDDAPHITPERREQLYAAIPEYQREMRTKGIPLMGSGVIFPIDEARIKGYIPGIQLTGIPKWHYQLAGMDFGYGGEHPTAVAYLSYDADRDIIYVHDGFKNVGGTPIEVSSGMKKRGEWIPIAWPHDGEAVKGSRDGSYVKTADQYRDESINMMSHHATFEDGSNGREAGLQEMFMRMKTGRFIVAPHLTEFFQEFRLYHRKDGKVVDKNDDFISACRYGMMMIRYAERAPIEENHEERSRGKPGSMGY